MEVIPVSGEAVLRALEVLRFGGVIAHATETCYGFACDLTNPDAVKKLFAIKKRPADQPVSALFSSIDEAKQYVEWNDEAQRFAERFLPGPLTMILPMRNNALRQLSSIPLEDIRRQTSDARKSEICRLKSDVSLGVRISSYPIAQALVQRFGSPISTTSANLHGHPNPYSPDEIIAQFSALDLQPDLILDSGRLPLTPPSTVIDLTKGQETILRRGEIAPE